MVHLRLNEKEPNPNPHINFITVLPAEDDEPARQLLRALAAQVKPIMKSHGLGVNSFEEYEWNRVFGGRNWNAGETVEIVLRGPKGSFLSTPWLLNVVCHELAHIKHMNHGAAFQSLWASLRSEVLDLQMKGYYGDGYWSSGQRLVDSARVGRGGLELTEFPEYLCGGAQGRSRPKASKRRHRSSGNPNSSSKKRKAGSRVKKDFGGQGVALNEGLDNDKGTGFRKKAQSNRAREERALAAERRLLALQKTSYKSPESESSTESDGESDTGQLVVERDEDRRRTMLEATQDGDTEMDKLTGQCKIEDFKDYFKLPAFASERQPSAGPSRQGKNTIEVDLTMDDDDDDFGCDIQPLTAPKGSTAAGVASTSSRPVPSTRPGLRKIQAKGNTPPQVIDVDQDENEEEWNCQVCTLSNPPNYLACGVCGTTKGGLVWKG